MWIQSKREYYFLFILQCILCHLFLLTKWHSDSRFRSYWKTYAFIYLFIISRKVYYNDRINNFYYFISAGNTGFRFVSFSLSSHIKYTHTSIITTNNIKSDKNNLFFMYSYKPCEFINKKKRNKGLWSLCLSYFITISLKLFLKPENRLCMALLHILDLFKRKT